jgi:imidazolonepropionase-like amidohydrolase
VEYGVRSIEHGTLIDEETARFVAQKGAYVVPTMTIIFAIIELGRRLGFPPQSQDKAEYVFKQAISGLDIMRRAGVKLAYGTDLLGPTYVRQCREFTLRREVFSPIELLRQATSVPAELMMLKGEIAVSAGGRSRTRRSTAIRRGHRPARPPTASGVDRARRRGPQMDLP